MTEAFVKGKPTESPKVLDLYGTRGVLTIPHPKNADGKNVCRWCHGELPKGRSSWCSKDCFFTYQSRGGDWRITKREILRRDKHTCQLCGTDCRWDVDSEVDHIVPVIEGGDDRPSNLRCLCVDCHKQETATLRKRQGAAKA